MHVPEEVGYAPWLGGGARRHSLLGIWLHRIGSCRLSQGFLRCISSGPAQQT